MSAGGVDWLSLESTDPRVPEYAREDAWTFISYGRTPAIEIVISTATVGEGAVADILTQFAPAANQIEAERTCLDLTDAPQVEN